MKIVTPLSTVGHYIPLMKAGADEFYSGILPIEWLKKYNMTMPINRREWFLSECNICTYTEMKILSKMVKEYQIPIKITLNSHYYVREQYPLLLDVINRLMDIGFDTFIISDIALIEYIRKKKISCNIHLSGETEVVNHLSMSLMEKYEITRYVFPRKITLNNMKQVISSINKPDHEFEAFILNSFCQYSGGLCNCIHCDYLPTTCWLNNKITPRDKNKDKFMKVTRTLKIIEQSLKNNMSKKNANKDYIFANSGCGVCHIDELKSIGVRYLKVVGRGHELDSLVKDVAIVKDIINETNSYDKSKEYIIEKYHKNTCPERCYYT